MQTVNRIEVRAVYYSGKDSAQSWPLTELAEAQAITGKSEPDAYGVYKHVFDASIGGDRLEWQCDYPTLTQASGDAERYRHAKKDCRCNNCMNEYFEEDLQVFTDLGNKTKDILYYTGCPKCKTDAYLMDT